LAAAALDGGDAAEPAVILDENELAREHAYFRLGGLEASPDGDLLAYAADEDGSERFRLRVKDLGSGEVPAGPGDERVGRGGVGGGRAHDPLRRAERQPAAVPGRAHRLGEDPADDPILYEEEDPAFFVSLGKTLSRRFVVIGTGTHVTTELRLLDAAEPLAEPRLVAARRDGPPLQPRPRARPGVRPDQRPARELPARHGPRGRAR
jgi:oligopeptidase B